MEEGWRGLGWQEWEGWDGAGQDVREGVDDGDGSDEDLQIGLLLRHEKRMADMSIKMTEPFLGKGLEVLALST